MRIKPLHFAAFLVVLNLVQVALTELTSDEGYYWFYSRSLEWGYAEHPPLIALMVRIGYALFPNQLGVRLVNVILNALSVLLVFKLVPRRDSKNDARTYLMVLSLPLLNYLAFIIFPDGPLLLFVVSFLIGYRRFLAKEDVPAVLLIGLSTALMLYSKYLGILVVGFTVLSNLQAAALPQVLAGDVACAGPVPAPPGVAVHPPVPDLRVSVGGPGRPHQHQPPLRVHQPTAPGDRARADLHSVRLQDQGPFRASLAGDLHRHLRPFPLHGFDDVRPLSLDGHHPLPAAAACLEVLRGRHAEATLSLPGAADGPRRRAAPAVLDVLDCPGEPHLSGLLPRPGPVVAGHQEGGR